MKLEKAKEILELNLKVADKKMPPDVKDALQLSIEALERLPIYRNRHPELIWELLPSETFD